MWSHPYRTEALSSHQSQHWNTTFTSLHLAQVPDTEKVEKCRKCKPLLYARRPLINCVLTMYLIFRPLFPNQSVSSGRYVQLQHRPYEPPHDFLAWLWHRYHPFYYGYWWDPSISAISSSTSFYCLASLRVSGPPVACIPLPLYIYTITDLPSKNPGTFIYLN